MSETHLITAGLPYANGSIHIGHLVEYIMTDIYARAVRMEGNEAIYVCADDTHGTPIEINARKAGQSPEDFVARWYDEHIHDLESFGIRFDSFYSTNTEENRRWVHEIYEKLKAKGHIERRPMEQLYDEEIGRFLPDRFVKGTCPNCHTEDQYGDVCESCGKTYEPTDLIDPYSVLSNSRPVVRESEHLFVKLVHFKDMLDGWLKGPGRLQPEIERFVRGWLDQGLEDWCITRDEPYFGFAVPDLPNKYFYVWIDAPIGYISSTEHWAKTTGQPDRLNEIWREGKAKVVHVIGKDITYFHTLFWPAMLSAAELKTPDRVQVHGMLLVDGVKMSKTRGTFIMASRFREHLDPTYLRWYFGSKIGASPEDIDLSTDEFVQRVNAELVNNIANLVSRSASFAKNKLDGRFGALPADADVLRGLAEQKIERARGCYAAFDLAGAVRAALEIADAGNRYFQDHAPWNLVKTDPEAARAVVTLSANLARAAAVLVAPVVPELSASIHAVLGRPAPAHFDEALAFDLVDREVGEPRRLIDRMPAKALNDLIEASKPNEAPATPEAAPAGAKKQKGTEKKSEGPPAESKAKLEDDGIITIDDLERVNLRVGLVRAAQAVEGADKLLKLTVDIGEAQPRTIFAGIALAYAPEQLVGRRVVVVANLKPRKMRFGTSEGMVLAAGPGGSDIQLVSVDEGATPGAEVK
jgi:methionyl-tRNA synthetase